MVFPGDDFCHPDHLLYPVKCVHTSHDMLGGIVQSGKEAVYIYLFQWQFVRIGRQHKQVDVIQSVNQSGDTFEII